MQNSTISLLLLFLNLIFFSDFRNVNLSNQADIELSLTTCEITSFANNLDSESEGYFYIQNSNLSPTCNVLSDLSIILAKIISFDAKILVAESGNTEVVQEEGSADTESSNTEVVQEEGSADTESSNTEVVQEEGSADTESSNTEVVNEGEVVENEPRNPTTFLEDIGYNSAFLFLFLILLLCIISLLIWTYRNMKPDSSEISPENNFHAATLYIDFIFNVLSSISPDHPLFELLEQRISYIRNPESIEETTDEKSINYPDYKILNSRYQDLSTIYTELNKKTQDLNSILEEHSKQIQAVSELTNNNRQVFFSDLKKANKICDNLLDDNKQYKEQRDQLELTQNTLLERITQIDSRILSLEEELEKSRSTIHILSQELEDFNQPIDEPYDSSSGLINSNYYDRKSVDTVEEILTKHPGLKNLICSYHSVDSISKLQNIVRHAVLVAQDEKSFSENYLVEKDQFSFQANSAGNFLALALDSPSIQSTYWLFPKYKFHITQQLVNDYFIKLFELRNTSQQKYELIIPAKLEFQETTDQWVLSSRGRMLIHTSFSLE